MSVSFAPFARNGCHLVDDLDFAGLWIEAAIGVAPVAERHRPECLALELERTHGEASALRSKESFDFGNHRQDCLRDGVQTGFVDRNQLCTGTTDDRLDVPGERLITCQSITLANDDDRYLTGAHRREQLSERGTLFLVLRATDSVVAQHVEDGRSLKRWRRM